MPYKRRGKLVLHFKGGGWKIKQHALSAKNAKTIMRILKGIEYKHMRR